MADLIDPGFLRLLPINPRHLLKVTGGTLFNMADTQRDLTGWEGLIPVVHSLEFASINGTTSTNKNANTPTQVYKLRTGLADGRRIHSAEVCNRLVIRGQTPHQPHELGVRISPQLAKPDLP